MEKSLAIEMLKELKSNSKRWFVVAVIELVLLLGSNIAWLIYESQFETVTEEKTQGIYYADNSTVTQDME